MCLCPRGDVGWEHGVIVIRQALCHNVHKYGYCELYLWLLRIVFDCDEGDCLLCLSATHTTDHTFHIDYSKFCHVYYFYTLQLHTQTNLSLCSLLCRSCTMHCIYLALNLWRSCNDSLQFQDVQLYART